MGQRLHRGGRLRHGRSWSATPGGARSAGATGRRGSSWTAPTWHGVADAVGTPARRPRLRAPAWARRGGRGSSASTRGRGSPSGSPPGSARPPPPDAPCAGLRGGRCPGVPCARETDRRCPNCAALVSADADWCGQCFTSLRATRPRAGSRPLASPCGTAGPRPSGRRPFWPCSVCGDRRTRSCWTCAACAARRSAAPAGGGGAPTVRPAMRSRSLVFPGIGHAMLGRRDRRLRPRRVVRAHVRTRAGHRRRRASQRPGLRLVGPAPRFGAGRSTCCPRPRRTGSPTAGRRSSPLGCCCGRRWA